MTITLIDRKKFAGGKNLAPDSDPGGELGDDILELQTAVNLVENGIVDGDFAGTAIGRMVRTGSGTYAVVQDSIANVIAPTVNNDATGGAGGKQKGFGVGSIWIDVTADKAYVCLDATNTAAVWRQIDVTAASVAAATAVMDGDFAGATAGRMTRTGAGAYAVILDNLAAVVPPNPAVDDITLGYEIGSIWIDTAADLIYICADNTNGAAVWRLTMNVVAAGGELAGNYPNPTVADGVIDAANALAGAVAGLSVDKGVPSSCLIAFDNAGGAAQRPADGASYTFSIGGGALAAIEARDVVVDQYDFLRSSVGAEEADTILMAAAFAAAINANTVIGLRIRAEVYGGAGDGRWYVACYTRLQADITAGSALTCVLAGGQPGVYQARATAVAASKSQLFPFEYAVTAQDVLAGEIRFSFGCTAVKAYFVDILTAVGNYTRIAWTGAPSIVGGVLLIDNAGGGTDWAAGNIIRGWLIGTVA